MALSPFNPDVLYLGGEVLFKSTTHGMSWTIISPDLTHNDKSKQISTPGPLTPDNSSAEYYDTIFAVAESPVQKDLIWAGIGRWIGAHHERRRQKLDKGYAERFAGLVPRELHRAIAVGCRHGVSVRRFTLLQRLQADCI